LLCVWIKLITSNPFTTPSRPQELSTAIDAKNDDLDALFAEMDRNLMHSRDVFQAADVHLRGFEQDEWEMVKMRAQARGESECAICMNTIHTKTGGKPVYLLSCSHVFHTQCMNSLERFTAKRFEEAEGYGADDSNDDRDEGDANNGDGHDEDANLTAMVGSKCPMCRAPYKKLLWNMQT
jgi:hypothetical protein